MKRIVFIGFLFGLALLIACTQKLKVVEPVETPSLELCAIDNLLWYHPDSALMCLIPYFDTCCREAGFCVSTATAFNRHYAHLLLSELLYKNDYPQTNRKELLQAVAYFDSIAQVPEPAVAEHSRSIEGPSKEQIIFLNARIHYINGVGYYEQDSLVQACAEYLKTLEIMENHFEEKELIGHKARFMAYTYNRLGDMFEEQLLAEPAIASYKQALAFCKREPTSKYGIPVVLYSIGIQFDVSGQLDSACFYYDEALTNIPDYDNIHYRDIMTTKAVNAYKLGLCVDSVIKDLKHIVSHASDEGERITRFLTIGNILFESKHYDSSWFYLNYVFEQKDDIPSKIVAANNLCSLYQMKGDSVKANQYSSYLANFTLLEIEKKKDVSKINEMFKEYLNQKQEKQAETERNKAVKKVMRIIIPIAVLVALIILVFAKQSGRKKLKEQQEEADRALEDTKRKHEADLAKQEEMTRKALEDAEKLHEQSLLQQRTETETLLEEKDRQLEKEKKARQREKEKLQHGIQQREEQVSALEKALYQQREEAELRREAFMKETICCKINDSIRSQRITARNSHEKYVSFTEEDAVALKAAVLKHYENFESFLLGKYPKLSNDDLQLCQLYLMGLDERQIAVLQNKSYSAIKKRSSTLKDLLGLDENLQAYLLKFSSFQEF